MAEDKTKSLVNKIEKLIIDGNKEVVAQLDHKIEQVKIDILTEVDIKINGVKQELGGKIDRLDKKVDHLDATLDATARASYDLLTDVRDDVKRVSDKLDKHLLVPHAV
jgi:signal transduction histidine kinase